MGFLLRKWIDVKFKLSLERLVFKWEKIDISDIGPQAVLAT
jgi:hypothetical protein